MPRPDGDIVRALGFVTLYSAYAEEEVDYLLEMLSAVEPYGDSKHRWPVSRKLKLALGIVRRLDQAELQDLVQAIVNGPKLFDKRNELVHGRIYSDYPRPKIKSGRQHVPERAVEASELYDLASTFKSYAGCLRAPRAFRLPRALSRHRPGEI